MVENARRYEKTIPYLLLANDCPRLHYPSPHHTTPACLSLSLPPPPPPLPRLSPRHWQRRRQRLARLRPPHRQPPRRQWRRQWRIPCARSERGGIGRWWGIGCATDDSNSMRMAEQRYLLARKLQQRDSPIRLFCFVLECAEKKNPTDYYKPLAMSSSASSPISIAII